MDNYIYLKHNVDAILINNLKTGNDKIFESLSFQPGEVWYDNDGIIRHFSVKYNDGRIGNYFLMPINMNYNNYIQVLGKDLAEFGLKIISDSIFNGSTIVLNLGKFFFEKYGKLMISDLGISKGKSAMGYVALDNNEIVFKGILDINTAINLNSLKFYIRNDTEYRIKYAISRDLNHWNTEIVEAFSNREYFFGNRQMMGYFKMYTNDIPGIVYEIKAQHSYIIRWNASRQLWEFNLIA